MTVTTETRTAPRIGDRITREYRIAERAIDPEARTVELAFASETPVERWYGYEVLKCAAGNVRLDRLNNGGALLCNHDFDCQIGVVEQARAAGADGKCRALVRFSRAAEAEDYFQDVVDGIRQLVSVGYIIHAVEERTEANITTYTVTDWEPYEISVVSVPADVTVGVGRSFHPQPEEPTMTATTDTTETRHPASVIDITSVENQARAAERDRVSRLNKMGRQFDIPAEVTQRMIEDGKTIDDLTDYMLVEQEKRNATKKPLGEPVGLSDKEIGQFRMLRVLNALANPTDRAARNAAAFELEACRAAADTLGRTPQGVFLPPEVLGRGLSRRDLTVGTATAGGNLVATDLMAGDFIDVLRNAMVLSGMGVRMMTGLQGNVAIPRQTGGATAYWVAESGAPTESAQAFDQVTLSPKTVGAFTDISRKLLLQSSIDVEMLVRTDLFTILGLELERVVINGSGSGAEPRGILNTTGIGSVAGGTNGAAPTWANIIDLETSVASANAAIGQLGYLTNTKVRGKLKQTYTNPTYGEIPVWASDNTVNGYQTAVTNAVPSSLTKGTASGVCSAILFGNWADVLIGLWSGLDLNVDPYTFSTTGTVRVTVLQDADVGFRHVESFGAMKDALTS